MGERITAVHGRRVWDSRGRPTVEAEVRLESGAIGKAIAPAGASTGSGEALDLRDGGTRFSGYGVSKAVDNVNRVIAEGLKGLDASSQPLVDEALVQLDGTENRSRLGGNAMIAVSMAVAHAVANHSGLPLWQHLAGVREPVIPVPEIQILGGGVHAGRRIDIQDFMVIPYAASTFSEATEWVSEIYACAGRLLGTSRCGVADEGGYWPVHPSNTGTLRLLLDAISQAGFDPEKEVGISLDVAATQLFDGARYHLRTEGRRFTPRQWQDMLLGWIADFAILSIEDPFHEEDFESHTRMTELVGARVQVVGDDLLTTKVSRVERACKEHACNTLLCKPNQAGTLTEAKAAFEAARLAGWETILSARSGDTEDVTIVHLAVGWGVRQLKVGSFSRSERMAKWNEVIRIEESLTGRATYCGPAVFGVRPDDRLTN